MKKVGIIAPSGVLENFNCEEVESFFSSWGIETKIYDSCFAKFRYMAGEDTLRLKDLHSAFEDETIDTIICARGGYGALRILDEINYDLIKQNKKPFVGFSDVTILLAAFYKKASLLSFHGKMAANGVVKMKEEEFLNYKNSIENPSFSSALSGGVLWGGNLASIVSLFDDGSSFVPDEDLILFLEDINEPDYKIDRMLTQILRNKTLPKRVKGVIFGDFIGAGKYLDEIKHEFVEKLGVPFEENLNITHGNSNVVVPFGLKI